MAIPEPPTNMNGAADTDTTSAIPDYLASPNAVFRDQGVQWRYEGAPDYSKTRKAWEEGKRMNHSSGSLEEMVENLVKNWEVEASFKPRLQDWRTIDHDKYSFAMGSGPPMSAEHMLKIGTYNGILAPSEYYSPENSDFASSHKTFKRMMPTFAWEVLEVYSGPPRVVLRWRHWGDMKNDYVGFNDKGEKVTAKAHGGIIDIQGVTVAQVDDRLRLQDVQTWMDPLEMFHQIAPNGIVDKQTMNKKVDLEVALDAGPDVDGSSIAQEHDETPAAEHNHDQTVEKVMAEHVSERVGKSADAFVPHQGTGTQQTGPSTPAETVSATAAFTSKQEEPDKPTVAAQAPVNAGAIPGISAPISTPPSHYPEAISNNTADKSISSELLCQQDHNLIDHPSECGTDVPSSVDAPVVTGPEEVNKLNSIEATVDESPGRDAIDEHLESSSDTVVHTSPQNSNEKDVAPPLGETVAVAAADDSEETRVWHEEMSRIFSSECPFLMKRE